MFVDHDLGREHVADDAHPHLCVKCGEYFPCEVNKLRVAVDKLTTKYQELEAYAERAITREMSR